jgi:hypothetical protein
MKKFSHIRKVYEQDEILTNIANVETAAQISPVVDEVPTEVPTEGSVVAFFSKLFESREMAHVYHLQVRGDEGSHAAHLALGEYYDGILDLIDTVIETYQGQYGIVDGYETIDTNGTKTKEKLAYFEELAEYVKHARKSISEEDTHLHSIVDDIVVLIYKTLYKLKFTK